VQEGRLAGAVGPDQRGDGAGGDGERGRGEDGATAVGQLEIGGGGRILEVGGGQQSDLRMITKISTV
jgi:hypothetical protein